MPDVQCFFANRHARISRQAEDDVPGFDIDERPPRRERSDGSAPTADATVSRFGASDDGHTTVSRLGASDDVAPGPEDLAQPALPQPPEWPYKLLTMPLPALSGPLAPPGGPRPAPYETPFNPIGSYPTTDENVREMGDATGGAVTEQWPSFDALTPLMDTDVRHSGATAQNANPQPAGEEAMQDAWPQPPMMAPHAQAAVAGPQDLSSAEMARQPIGNAATVRRIRRRP
jgi:hypothetical protein